MTRGERIAAAVQEAVKVNRVWGPDDTWEQHNARVVRAAIAVYQKDAPVVEILGCAIVKAEHNGEPPDGTYSLDPKLEGK